MRTIAILAAMTLGANAATVYSPDTGALYTLPGWAPGAVDAAHTPGNLEVHRIDRQVGAAPYVLQDAVLERLFYANEKQGATLPSPLDCDIVLADGYRCDATNRDLSAVGRRIAYPPDLTNMFSLAESSFPAFDTCSCYLATTNVWHYAKPDAWSSSLFGGSLPADTGWESGVAVENALAAHTNTLDYANLASSDCIPGDTGEGEQMSIVYRGLVHSAWGDSPIDVSQAYTLDEFLEPHFTNVVLAAITNTPLNRRLWGFGDKYKMGAMNAVLAASDITWHAGADNWNIGSFAATNVERNVTRTTKAELTGVLTYTNGTAGCSASFGGATWDTGSVSNGVELTGHSANGLFFTVGEAASSYAGYASTTNGYEIRLDDGEISNLIAAVNAVIPTSVGCPVIYYIEPGDATYGNSEITVPVDFAAWDDNGDYYVSRSFTLGFSPVGWGVTIFATVTGNGSWSYDEAYMPQCNGNIDTLPGGTPERPGNLGWLDGKASSVTALAYAQVFTNSVTNACARLKSYTYGSFNDGRRNAADDLSQVQAKTRAVALDAAGIFTDIDNLLTIEAGELESVARSMRITSADVTFIKGDVIEIELDGDKRSISDFGGLRHVGDVNVEISANVTTNIVRHYGSASATGTTRQLYRTRWGWGNLRMTNNN